ncbi:outer membrane protein assembly factor BamB family protein [Nocardia sp. NBC_00416]|uniref:outer membrane protein assembly factor BamB family protein n=1 Tax=Nocardia sp. NBC_00416 TaxID=2975991 RepID=UPI002E23D1B9
MALPSGMRTLVLAAVAAVLTSVGAVVVVVHHDEGPRRIAGDAVPELVWSLDASTTYGQPGAEFRSPVGGTEYDFGSAGFIDAGATMVTVLGIADDGMSLRDPVMYGIDADTGVTRWHAPAAELGGCASIPVHGVLVCFTSSWAETPALIGYDIADGTVTRTPVDWPVFALAADEEQVYVAEGDVESDDVRVHAGTLGDPDAHWTRMFAMGTAWEDLSGEILDVAHGQGVLTLGADVAGFDLATGEPTWTTELTGCSSLTGTSGALVVRLHAECGGPPGTAAADILDGAGRILATTDDGIVHDLMLDRAADETIPVLLGDTAYDRRDGTVRWTNPDLVRRLPDGNGGVGASGTATAVLGDTALLHDSATGALTGLDLRTGRELWRKSIPYFGSALAWDGDIAVFSDSIGLCAIDPGTGEIVWAAPFDAAAADSVGITGEGEFTVRNNGRYVYASARTMNGLTSPV